MWIEQLQQHFHNAAQRLQDTTEWWSSRPFFLPVTAGLVSFAAFVWGWCLLFPQLGSYFSQDSYAYYLIGKNIFNGLGYTTDCARDLSVPPVWPVLSKSFPPLHPLLVGLIDTISGQGIRSASVASLFYLGGTIIVMFLLGRELDNETRLFVFFAFIAVFASNEAYRDEFEGGRSIPGMIVYFLLLILFYLKTLPPNPRKKTYEILCGIAAGAMLLQRFDQTIFVLAFLFLCFFVYRRFGLSASSSLQRTGIIVAAFVVTVLPWAIRNTIQFGAPFASDNTGAVTGTFRGLACCAFWPEGAVRQTIFTHPALWMHQRLDNLVQNFSRILELTNWVVCVVPIAVAVMWKTFPSRHKFYIFLALVHFGTTLFTISITPYGDRRYFSLVHLNTFIVATICIANLFHLRPMRPFRGAIQLGMIVLLLEMAVWGPNLRRIETGILSKTLIPQNTGKLKSRYAAMERIVRKHLKNDDLLSVKPNADGYTVFTGRRTVYFPSTIKNKRSDFAEWIKAWSVDYLLIPKGMVDALQLDKFVVDTVLGAKLVDANAFLKSKPKQKIESPRKMR
jgi:hypothetical protein